MAVSVFKVLPLVELFVAFLGEYISLFISPNIILLFCAVYPILMGSVQKTMGFLNSRFELHLDIVVELYSLFYASLPYKLVYLGIETFLVGYIVLGIKICYKIIIYILTPWYKQRKMVKKEDVKKKSSLNQISSMDEIIDYEQYDLGDKDKSVTQIKTVNSQSKDPE